MNIWDFLQLSGQDRTRALNRFMNEDVAHYIPPELRSRLNFLGEMTPTAQMGAAMQDSGEMFAPGRTAGERFNSGVSMLTNTAGAVAPMAGAGKYGAKAADAMMDTVMGFAPMARGAADSAGQFAMDESGALIKGWHRTPAQFDELQLGGDRSGKGIWFSRDPSNLPSGRSASGNRLIEADVEISNPLELDEFNLREMQDRFAGGSKEFPFYLSDEARANLQRGDFDGIIADDVYGDGRVNEMVALDPRQIRSQRDVPLPGLLDSAPDETGSLRAGRSSMGHNGAPDPTLMDVLEARAAQMDLPIKDRIKPRLNVGVFDRDYMTPAPVDAFEDLSAKYPRNADPAAPLPLGDRARILVDRRQELAQRLAERIRGTGQMDADTRYFYHSDGPIYRAAKNAGLSDEEATRYLNDLSQNMAATSPRTKVEENLRNATLTMAKQDQGIPFREIIGPGTVDAKGNRGISERGYPMMTGKGGLHGGLLDDVANTGQMDVRRNPKPSTFGGNLAGNRSGVTVDTHAIRGTLQTLNEMAPGSVPDGFIIPKYLKAYKADPSILTPDMIQDTLGSQMTGPKGAREKLQTEYSVFADIWHDAADILGVDPAEAQSMGWFGFGDQTNLGSARKTPVDIFDERVDVTAQALGISPERAAKLVFQRKIPLMAVGGGGLLATGALEQQQQDQYRGGT